MLEWYEHLYVGENVKKKFEHFQKKLEKGKPVPGLYLITLPSGECDQLEIINSFYLLQNTVYRRCPMIMGIAKGYEEACNLVISMTEECFTHTGTGNIKEYLMQR